MTKVLLIDESSTIDIDTTEGSAVIYSDDIDFSMHAVKMVRVLDDTGKAAWGIATGEVSSDNWASIESLPSADDGKFSEIEDGFTEANIVSISVMASIAPFVDMDPVERIRSQIRTPMEAGYVNSRLRFPRTRERYELMYRLKTENAFDEFVDFFDDNQGGHFLMTRPKKNTVIIAMFSGDHLTWKSLGINGYEIKTTIEEV